MTTSLRRILGWVPGGAGERASKPLSDLSGTDRDQPPLQGPRVLHVASHVGPLLGIFKQMEWEQEVANNLAIPWTSRLIAPHGTYRDSEIFVPVKFGFNNIFGRLTALNYIHMRLQSWRYIFRMAPQHDVVLIRYAPHDLFQMILIVTLVARRIKVITVHHSIEAMEILNHGFLSTMIRRALERLTGGISVNVAAGSIGVTEEILAYQSQRCVSRKRFAQVYPNGIRFPVEPVDDQRQSPPTFLFLANEFQPWQGLDLLVLSAAKTDTDFRVHVVGQLSHSQSKMVACDPRFIAHGSLQIDQVRRLAAESWLGISSLALWRQGLSQACALKVREYLAWGLPTAGNYEETLPDSFPYYCKEVPDVEALLSVAYRFRNTPRLEVAEASETLISKAVALNQLWQSLSFWLKESSVVVRPRDLSSS